MIETGNAAKTDCNVSLTTAARHLTFRRAALVTISSIEQSTMATDNIKQFVNMNKQLLQLKTACMRAEQEFCNALSQMSKEDKECIVMVLIDRDGDGKVSLRELATAFQKMDPTKSYAQSVEDANLSIQKADGDNDGMMDKSEFGCFMDELVDALKCTFDEVCFVLIQWLAFNDTGDDILQDTLEENYANSGQMKAHLSEYKDDVVEARIALLFQYLDYNGKGKVLFMDVFEHLFQVVKNMNQQTRNLLFMMDMGKTRELDYHQFTNLLFNVTAACPPGIHFHDIANAMTVAGASATKIHGTDMMNILAAIEIDKAIMDNVPKDLLGEMTPLTYERIKNLFRMSDTDGNGYIEADELVLSIRKLQGTSKDIDETIDDTVSMIAYADKDQDQRLNLEEYADFVSALASTLDTDVNELVSYLAVELALRDHNDEAEKAYVQNMKKQMVRKVKAKQGRDRREMASGRGWMAFLGLVHREISSI